ncbi:CNNM domain-containing protein [Elusimicrobiota bacterium]
MDDLLLRIIISIVLLVLNAYFVMAEFALIKVRSSRLELLARQGNSGAAVAQKMLGELDVYLSACQLGITMASLGLGWIGEPAVAHLFEGWLRGVPLLAGEVFTHGIALTLAFGLITFMHIVAGELIPRSFAIQRAEFVSIWVTFPLRMFVLVFRLPIAFMADVSIWVLRRFGMGAAADADASVTEDEMRVIVGASGVKEGFSLERLMLFENIFDLARAKVSEAMIPREKVAYLSLARSWRENVQVIREKRFSRYPLCETDLDSVFGIVLLKDLVFSMETLDEEVDLRSHTRDIADLPPGESLQKVLRVFPDKGIHMAVIREGKGPVLGIVTLEDVLEEVVGEIQDEFDLPKAWSLADMIVPSAVEIDVKETDRKKVIGKMLDRLHQAHPTLDRGRALKAVLEREAKLSSAVGQGVAVPHARIPGLPRPMIAVGRSQKGFAFPAPDTKPVRLAFLILTPASKTTTHLKILARVASLTSNENLHGRLLRAKSPQRLMEILRTADTVLAE